MEVKDKVLACVKVKGPVMPLQVAKEIGKDSFYAGAILSELVNNKIIKISSAKIGGTPVYYMPGQEEKLSILYNGLPQKEKEAYNFLKEKKVAYDKDIEPAIRVALRVIRDFAIPSYDEQRNIVWRWYLHKEIKQDSQQQKKESSSAIPPALLNAAVQGTQLQRQTQEITPLPPSTQPLRKEQEEITPLMRQVVQEREEIPETGAKKKIKKEAQENFMQTVREYITNNHIQVIEEKIIKKNKEYEVLAKVPSNVGLLEYVIIARNKKKVADSDLSLAHNQGQLRKLPVIFLTNGELSKKAKDYKERNLKGFMIVKQV